MAVEHNICPLLVGLRPTKQPDRQSFRQPLQPSSAKSTPSLWGICLQKGLNVITLPLVAVMYEKFLQTQQGMRRQTPKSIWGQWVQWWKSWDRLWNSYIYNPKYLYKFRSHSNVGSYPSTLTLEVWPDVDPFFILQYVPLIIN